MKSKTTLDPKTFGYWAHLALKKHFKKAVKHETVVLEDKDPEALHQMRVGMRRLRTAIAGFAPALSLPKAAKEKQIAKVARQLGELRDLDILQDALQNQYLPDLPTAEQDRLKKVLKTLNKQRQKSLEQVQDTLNQQGYQKLKQSLQDWLEQPTYGDFAEFSMVDALPDLLLPPVSQLFLHPAWLVGVELKAGEVIVADDLDPNWLVQLLDTHGHILHSLRKQAKQVRYQMELFADFYDSGYEDYLKDLRAIQGVLGQIQDSFVLAEFLSDALSSELASQLPTLATRFSEMRYKLWQEWQSFQQQYLDSQVRQDLHQVLLKPVAQETR